LKKQIFASFISIVIVHQTFAQLTDNKIAGEYYLKGVMEVGSGFRFLEDHTFDFFFSYGALDRMGKGTWKLVEDKIVLNSESWPGERFQNEKTGK
jgi:hypothetical protein